MDRARIESLAGGRIWTGRQALANGLVDELGTLSDAVAAAWKMAGQPIDREPELFNLPKPRHFLDALFEGKLDSQSRLRLTRLLDLPEFARPLGEVESLLRLRAEPVWLISPHRVELR
jgi:protease-4